MKVITVSRFFKTSSIDIQVFRWNEHYVSPVITRDAAICRFLNDRCHYLQSMPPLHSSTCVITFCLSETRYHNKIDALENLALRVRLLCNVSPFTPGSYENYDLISLIFVRIHRQTGRECRNAEFALNFQTRGRDRM